MRKQPVALSHSEGAEDEEEDGESSSEDETEHLEIERVLDGRTNADSKQEEFLVKFKGDVPSLHVFVPQLACGIPSKYGTMMHPCMYDCHNRLQSSSILLQQSSADAGSFGAHKLDGR